MTKHILMLTGITFSLVTSGCSVFEGITGKKSATTISGDSATEVTNIVTNNPSTDRTASQQGNSQNREIPPIRIQPPVVAQPDSADKAPAPTVTKISGLSRVIGGNWTIVQVGTTVIDRDEDMPYIVFVPGDGSFYANNGCNTLNGSFSLNDDKITFHNVLTTMRLCPDVTFDHDINVVIADETETTLKVSEVGSETILEFITSTGKQLMRLRRGNLEFLNGQWDITAVAGLKELKAPATVFFDLTDMKLHGNTGCNFINGEIYLDHRMPNAVDFSQIITTLRACQYPEQQTAILVGLEETTSAISDGVDKVLLLGENGQIMLELKKSPVNQ